MNRDDYVKLIKNAFIASSKRAAQAALAVQAPFTQALFVKPFTDAILDIVITSVVDGSETQIYFAFIDFRTSVQGRTFEKAMLDYQKALKEGNPDAIKNFEDVLIHDARELIKLRN